MKIKNFSNEILILFEKTFPFPGRRFGKRQRSKESRVIGVVCKYTTEIESRPAREREESWLAKYLTGKGKTLKKVFFRKKILYTLFRPFGLISASTHSQTEGEFDQGTLQNLFDSASEGGINL